MPLFLGVSEYRYAPSAERFLLVPALHRHGRRPDHLCDRPPPKRGLSATLAWSAPTGATAALRAGSKNSTSRVPGTGRPVQASAASSTPRTGLTATCAM